MRHLMVLAALFGLIVAQPALSQAPGNAPVRTGNEAVAPPCDGDIANVRLIQITPKGTMANYLKALDAHRAWYRAHGFTKNQIFAAKVMVLDKASNSYKCAKDQMLSFHIAPPFMPGSTGHDAAWDAFHNLYRENSDIKTTFNVCMPKNR